MADQLAAVGHPVAATYTYLFHDLLSGEQLAALPLSEVTLSRRLLDVGELTGTVKGLATRRIRRLDPVAATMPGRTAVYVDRDGTLVWGGVLWGRRGTDTLQLHAEEFRSYWRRRRIRWDLDYSPADQLAILCGLLERAAGEPHGDIGLQLPPEWARITGLLHTVSYVAAERKPVEEAWGELEGLPGAFETSIEVMYGPGGEPVKRLTWGTPLGTERGVVFEKPGNLLDHGGWPEDAATMANRWTAIGGSPQDSTGNLPPLLADSSLPPLGWPLLEDSSSYTDLAKNVWLPLLQGHADHDLQVASHPATSPELLVSGDDPPVGAYRPGDSVRVRVTDPRFPRPAAGGVGLDTTLRVLGWEVSPPSSGRETVKVSVGTDVVHRRTLYRRLRHLERRLRRLESRTPQAP